MCSSGLQKVSRLFTGQGTVVEACSASGSNLEAPLKKGACCAFLERKVGMYIYIFIYNIHNLLALLPSSRCRDDLTSLDSLGTRFLQGFILDLNVFYVLLCS